MTDYELKFSDEYDWKPVNTDMYKQLASIGATHVGFKAGFSVDIREKIPVTPYQYRGPNDSEWQSFTGLLNGKEQVIALLDKVPSAVVTVRYSNGTFEFRKVS